MMHACNAVDGTAKKLFPSLGPAARFTRLIRQNYSVLGPMALPIPDIVNFRFDVKVENPKAPGGNPDAADVIYAIHRCCHNHGEALPDGFELIRDGIGKEDGNSVLIDFASGTVNFSERLIFALLGIVVYAPINAHQKNPKLDGYYLSFNSQEYLINEWWGRMEEMKKIIEGYGERTLVIREYK